MKHHSDAGFSYIDVMIALVILMVGVLALLSGITASIVQTNGQEQQLLAKQIVTTTMESIMSVKETDPNRLGWGAIGNVGTNPHPLTGVNQGVSVLGFQPVLTDAGADEVIGTADDTGTAVTGVQRQIVITDLCDPAVTSPYKQSLRPARTTVMRFAMISGDTITSMTATPNQGSGDTRLNGGVHNFKTVSQRLGRRPARLHRFADQPLQFEEQ